MQVVPLLAPLLDHRADLLPDDQGHADGGLARIGHRHGVVEEDHHAVAGEALQRALVGEDQAAGRGVVVAQHHHDLLGLRGFGKGREAAEVEEHHRDLPTVALQRIARAPRDDELGELRGEEALEPAHALELPDLLRHALLEPLVERGQLGGLARDAGALLPDRVVQALDAQHGLDARDHRGLVHGLGEVLVSSGVEPGHDVLGVRLGGDHDDGHEGQREVGLELTADLDAIHLGHHDVEQDQVRELLAGHGQRLLPVGGRDDVVALSREPGLQDVHVHGVVVDHQDERRGSHGRDSRIVPSSARGLKGLVT